ncbi:MAG: bis(5'-nucleosyl)-tetraphosphatase (symmetrical) YqeK [Lachnospiraceae bacterium]|nr:bis(5'-nucleosyl)-tetraphosphatase (symmetrical) YqeK [Lachnospiraceae bacterium]
MIDLRKIRKAMEKTLDSKRYEHTLGVEFTAAALAMRYGASIQKAQLAGLLHDCAKCMSGDKMIAVCEKYHVDISDMERRNPSLLHAKAGSYLAKEEYDVDDRDVICAIWNHTTGRPGMSLLEKIVFVADYIEPGRNRAENLAQIRTLAFKDLDAAVRQILEDTLHYLETKGGEIDPMTRETLEYYSK